MENDKQAFIDFTLSSWFYKTFVEIWIEMSNSSETRLFIYIASETTSILYIPNYINAKHVNWFYIFIL